MIKFDRWREFFWLNIHLWRLWIGAEGYRCDWHENCRRFYFHICGEWNQKHLFEWENR